MEFGVIFDFDGVIVDSSHHHEESWVILSEREGKLLPKDGFKKGFGRKNDYIIPEILKWSTDKIEIERTGSEKESIYRKLVEQKGIELLPGVLSLLTELKKNKIKVALGSSTERANIDMIFKKTGIDVFFDAIVSADDVLEGKPNPEVFLKAASKIQIDPKFCIVFEDSLAGIEAALTGGMKVIGVSTTYPPEKLMHANRVVPNLEKITPQDLASFWVNKKESECICSK